MLVNNMDNQPSPVPVPNPQPQNQSSNKHEALISGETSPNIKKRRLGLVLLVGILLAVLGAYARWYALETEDHNNVLALASAKITHRPVLLPRFSSAQTASWQAYTSHVGGFSFKYPATGWSLETFDGHPARWMSGSELTGNEARLYLKENLGTGKSDATAQFWINMNIASSASDVNTYNGYITPKWGSTLGTLASGIKVWETAKSTYDHPNSLKCGFTNVGIVWMGTQTNAKSYTALPNGKYLNYISSFCQGGSANRLHLSYGAQARGSEMQTAQAVLESISYQ